MASDPAKPPPAAAPPPSPSPPPRPARWVAWCVVLGSAIVIGYFGFHWYTYRQSHSITDDAFVEAHIVNVACDIAQQGIATPRDIDRAVTLGLGYRQGPLTMGDTLTTPGVRASSASSGCH